MLKIAVIFTLSVAILAVDITIREIPETYFEWKLRNFLALPTEHNFYLLSPIFSFASAEWRLKIHTNGSTLEGTRGYNSVYLIKMDSEATYRIHLNLGINRPDGSKFVSFRKEAMFDKVNDAHGWDRPLQRSTLERWKDTVLTEGTLTVFCKLRIMDSFEVIPQNVLTELDFHCLSICNQTDTLINESLPLCRTSDNTIEELKSRQNISTCNQSNSLIKESQPLCRTACNKTQGTEILSDNLLNMYTGKRFTDIAILCKNKEFSGHKNILFYRWTGFNSILENNSDKIEITDCDPDTFEVFLRFLYTGKLVDLSLAKATSLYLMSDRHNQYGLKEECARYIIENELDIDSFYDILRFANLHSDSTLLMAVSEFFITNTKLIMSTKKWENFHADNPLQVNKLFLAYVEKKS